MPFCPNCGTESQGTFCANCGTSIAAPQAGASAAPPPPAAPATSQGGLETNVASALCYLFGLLTGILFLVLDPYSKNKTVRFHAFQSIFFNLAMIVVSITLSILSFVFLFIPYVGGLLSAGAYLVLMFGSLGVWIFLMYKAYNHQKFVLPIVGPLAEKQA